MDLDLDKPLVYVGIGARDTPLEQVKGSTRVYPIRRIESLAQTLAEHRWVLRTGLARGADQAFHRGAIKGGGRYELYLPWPAFELGARDRVTESVVMEQPTLDAFLLAQAIHPNWPRVGLRARPLHARNGHEVLGQELDDPADLVICWVANGSRDGIGRDSGGTGQALRIAAAKGIPVLNIARDDDVEVIQQLLGKRA
jgi:hypothetical protein